MPAEVADTREALLEAALDLIMTRGYASFSFQDLADRVGIRKASIHYHFPSKGALGVALVRRLHDRMQGLWVDLEDRHRHVGDRLRAVVQGVCDLGCNRICPIGSLHGELNALPEEVREAVRAFDREYLATYTRWFAQGRDRGELAYEGDPAAVAACFAGIKQASLQRQRSNPDEPARESLNQFLRLVGVDP